MTVLVHDAKQETNMQSGLLVDDLIYADDTLIVSVDEASADTYMRCIGKAGANYGLNFNWKKLELLRERCQATTLQPDGSEIISKDRITYLGSLLCDGSVGPELGRRLGAARSEFDKLARIWSHSTLSQDRKLRIFEACVLSKLLYALHTAWLNKQETARLDAFHVRCLRKIYGIPHSYISRVSNSSVLETAACERLSCILLKRQLHFLAHIAQKPDEDPARSVMFKASSCILQDRTYQRRRGRPRMTWISEVYKHALRIADNPANLHNLCQKPMQSSWKRAVQQYCSREFSCSCA